MKKIFYSFIIIPVILFVSCAFAQECIDIAKVPGLWEAYEVSGNYSRENEKELLAIIQSLESGEKTISDLPQDLCFKEGTSELLDSGKMISNVYIPHTSEPITVHVVFTGTWELKCNQLIGRIVPTYELDIIIDEKSVPKEQMEEMEKYVEMIKPEMLAEFTESLQSDPHLTEEGDIGEILFMGDRFVLMYSKADDTSPYSFYEKKI